MANFRYAGQQSLYRRIDNESHPLCLHCHGLYIAFHLEVSHLAYIYFLKSSYSIYKIYIKERQLSSQTSLPQLAVLPSMAQRRIFFFLKGLEGLWEMTDTEKKKKRNIHPIVRHPLY